MRSGTDDRESGLPRGQHFFSRRTDWPRGPNETALLLAAKKERGKKILDLTESNPTRCGFRYPAEDVLSCLALPENMHYAPAPTGSQLAREAVCAYYANKNLVVRPEQIVLTASTSEAYSFLFRLLANPGETLAFPRPSYPLFQYLVDLNDLRMQFYSLRYSGSWRIDPATLDGLPDNVRALVVVNPNNPTGSFIDGEDLALVRAACLRSGAALVSDEVFLDYAFAPSSGSKSLVCEKDQLTFVLGGLSKSLGLPQMKMSWIVVSGPEPLAQEALARLEIIADTYLSVNTPVQNAWPVWLRFLATIQTEIMTRVRHNQDIVTQVIAGKKDWQVLKADGGWYSVLRLPVGMDEEETVLTLLRDDDVYVHPGYFFDFEDEPYVVVSLLPPSDVLAEGMKRFLARF